MINWWLRRYSKCNIHKYSVFWFQNRRGKTMTLWNQHMFVPSVDIEIEASGSNFRDLAAGLVECIKTVLLLLFNFYTQFTSCKWTIRCYFNLKWNWVKFKFLYFKLVGSDSLENASWTNKHERLILYISYKKIW